MTAMPVGAGDKGIQAFNFMHPAESYEFIQRSVHLQRRPNPLLAHPVKDSVGAHGGTVGRQALQDQLLIAGNPRLPRF